MPPLVVELGAVAVAVGVWFGLYGLMLLATRPRGVTPVPATQDLGPEPPAVASLVASGWQFTEDAAEATLLDLGARKYIEFRQPGDDVRHTTIHLRADTPDLTPYERRVYERVRGLAKRARAGSSSKRLRASPSAERRAGKPNRAIASGRRGTWITGRSREWWVVRRG